MNKLLIVLFLFCSNVLFGQQTIKNLQWLNIDQEITELTVGYDLTLYAGTENINDNGIVTITIWEKGDAVEYLVGEYIAKVTDNKISFNWTLVYEKERQTLKRDIYKNGYTVQYYFKVQHNKIISHKSKLLDVLASEHLEPADIKRFKEHLSEFPNFFHEDIFHTNEDYYNLFRETVEDYGVAFEVLNYMYEDSAKEYAYSFRKYINELLNYNVPEVINNKYQSMGLFNNGHKKITIIIFGALYIAEQEALDYSRLLLERGFDEEEGDLDAHALEEIKRMRKMGKIHLDINYSLFNEQDLYILRNNMEFVKEILDIIPHLRGSGYDRCDRDGG